MGAPLGNCNAAKNKASCRLKKGKNKSELYFVSYTKKIGGKGIVEVKARNKAEAIGNAKSLVHTGTGFKFPRRTSSSKSVATISRTRGWRRGK